MDETVPFDRNTLVMIVADGEIKASGADPRAIAWHPPGALGIGKSEAFWLDLGSADGQQRHAAILMGDARRAEAAPFRAPRQAGFLALHQLSRASAAERQMAARAVHVGAWLHRSRYCGMCGAAMRFDTLRSKCVCTRPACGHQLYPRIEPAVITLLTDGERCLLARQPTFPAGFYAPIAGFVEAGETPEQAVAREVAEETGQVVLSAAYALAQPWPYPGSLMLGFIATAAPDQAIRLSAELEDARWVSRAQLAGALAQPGHDKLYLPPRGVIGHALLLHWLSHSAEAPPAAAA